MGPSPQPSPKGEGALRYRALYLSIGFGLVGLVIYLSLGSDAPDLGRVEDVKSGHFIAYFVLMLWFAQIFQSWKLRLAIGVALTLMGIGLEYAQGMTTYRTFAYTDMRDNALGVVLGLAAAMTPLGAALVKVEARIGR